MNEPLEQRLFTTKKDVATFLDTKESLIDIVGSIALTTTANIGMLNFGISFFDITFGAGIMGATRLCINHYYCKYDEFYNNNRESKIHFLRTLSIASFGALVKAYYSKEIDDSLSQSILTYIASCVSVFIPYFLLWGWKKPRDSDRLGDDPDDDDDDGDNSPPSGMHLDIPDYLPEDICVEEYSNENITTY